MMYLAAVFALAAAVPLGAAPPAPLRPPVNLRQSVEQYGRYDRASAPAPRELTPVQRAELRRQVSESARPAARRR